MRTKTSLVVYFIILFTACTSTKHSVFWVRGYKKPCVGIAEMQCLQVSRSADLDQAEWNYFYDTIYGFEFEPGYLKKIEVKQDTLAANEVPADASSIRYTLIRELKKKKEQDVLKGKWKLVNLRGENIIMKSNIPYIQFDTLENSVSGYDGCNQFFGEMNYSSNNKLRFKGLASTKMMCLDMSIPDMFTAAMLEMKSYKQIGQTLELVDQKGITIITLKKSKSF